DLNLPSSLLRSAKAVGLHSRPSSTSSYPSTHYSTYNLEAHNFSSILRKHNKAN
ncbi:unnamed protein product, partial [Musa acuminata subsp. burmannicoides]